MPLLLAVESDFEGLYGSGGRPNWSVARLLGICLLQHLAGRDDQEVLDSLSFDARFQHALDLSPEEAYLSRRSLVEFRRRLVAYDPDGVLLRKVFDRVCDAALDDLGVSTTSQRLDSTLVVSNIRAHGRVSLARETLRVFLASLSDDQRGLLPESLEIWENETKDDDVKDKSAALTRLGRLVSSALAAFADDVEVRSLEPYQLVERLAQEHASALGILSEDASENSDANDNDGDDDEPPSPQSAPKTNRNRTKRERARRNKKKTKARFWTPHDPDASFGHKGLGYHVHIAETCNNQQTELITDYHVVTAAQSDIGQSTPAIERLVASQRKPERLFADGGYTTPQSLVDAREAGTELHAPVNRGRMAQEAMSRADFKIDKGVVTECPEGNRPTRHGQRTSSDAANHRRGEHAFFDVGTCHPCPRRDLCPVRQPNHSRAREYRLDITPPLLARDARWVEQTTDDWKTAYRIRAGVEATMSELKRAHQMARLRVRRKPRVTIAIALKSTACNIKRWLKALRACLVMLTITLCSMLAAWTKMTENSACATPALRF